LNARENASSRIAFSSLVAVSWIDETASKPVPFIEIFNLENRKSQQALNHGWDNTGILLFAKNSEKTPEE
jgi:hypothetical protein